MINRREFIGSTSTAVASAAQARPAQARQSAAGSSLPNIVVILTDDQGYGDLGCYGSPDIRTPNIDGMARDGMRMTHFYAAPVCGPSRSAIMTGCYAARVGMNTNLGPKSQLALDPRETTLASLVKPLGYATQALGKWHLGSRPPFLPQRYGFDNFFGTPYSHDMWSFHPMTPPRPDESDRMKAARARAAYTGYDGQGHYLTPENQYPDLPLYQNNEIVEINPDISKLTSAYTDRAVKFITENHDRPFLLYLAHNMPHVPLFPSERFRGKSKRGLYGDVVEEIDWSVGEILKTLNHFGLDRRTMIVFTSDNGPWAPYGVDAGSAGPLRGVKATTWEGGMREPGIFRWTGTIPAGRVSSEVGATMDLLPTIAEMTGAKLPAHTIDGRSLLPLLRGSPDVRTPHDAFYYFHTNAFESAPDLQAIRMEHWKLRFDLQGGKLVPGGLYDLGEDIGENNDRALMYPDRVQTMLTTAQSFYDQLLKNIRPLVSTSA